ncbi:NAD-dependent epimerase/dehydratase family protein [Lentilactobacillus raoultii]|uniref:NAD-dependent epimerase/dehydratase family protein n=1 Tax=Lentilactobacillus raoultii TaxID=1987503 RepID=A0ABW3PL07_9LACO|nr:NAD-dependent epimerase/dehydratase family protein [Lentilactobacillus raoultii]
MIITVVGGNGYVGSGLLLELSQFADFQLFSISRSGQPARSSMLKNVHWIKGDVTQSGDWEAIIAKSDWVIDCVGILLPNPIKQTTYWKNSVQPAKTLINLIHRQNLAADKTPNTHFLFVSANYAPSLMKNYLKAKLEVEKDMAELLPKNSVAIYPGIITDQSKPLVKLFKAIAKVTTLSPYFKRLRFIPRTAVAQETVRILTGEDSFLTSRIEG